MNLPLSRWFFRNGFRLGLGILVLIGFLYFGQKKSLQNSFQWVIHTSHVQKVLSEFGQTVSHGNDPVKIQRELENLKKLVADNPRQTGRLNSIQNLLNERNDFLLNRAQSDVSADVARAEEAVFSILDDMRAEESRLLEERESLSQRNIFLLDLPIIFGTLFACFLIYSAHRITKRDLEEFIQKDKELEAYANNLKISRDTLEVQSNLMEFTLEAMADGLIVVNEKGEYLRVNPVAQELLGGVPHSINEFPRKDFKVIDAATGRYLKTEELAVRRSLNGESITDYELIIEKNGKFSKIISCNSHPVFNRERKLVGAITVFRDVTARKNLENELRKAQQSALDTTEAKSRFLANMSHEIRTPMNGIIGMADVLSQTELDSKQKSYLNLINESCQNLMTIVNDILDFSKIEAGKLEIEKTDFYLAQTLDRTIQLMAPKARARNLTLLAHVSSEIPAAVRGDSGRVGQILVNLVSNAIKFTPHGKVFVQAELLKSSENKIEVKFSVRDTGVGIEKNALERLFSPFSQVDTSTSRKFGGTGLGLSICKQLVDLMGGQIGVETELNQGSTFWFTVPFDLPMDYLPAPYQPISTNHQILIYDEDAQSAEILKDYISSWNLSVIHIKNQEEFNQLIEQAADLSQLHLIMVCQHNKNAQDLELSLGQFLKRQGKPQVTLVMDHEDSRFMSNYRNMGFASNLLRPIDQSALYAHLTEVLAANGHSKEQEMKKEPLAAPTPPARLLKRGRILLAEDNTVNQMIAQAFLTELGHTSHTVSNGKEAIESLKQFEFDLILMDCQMPVMDGFEATQEIRSRISSRIPIIALTANAMKGDEERCRKAGMNAYLSKPFHKDQLQRLLQEFLPEADLPFDPSRLDMFRGYKDDNNQDLRKALIDTYLLSATEGIERLEKLFLENPDDFRKSAHTLKSSTASVGGFHLAHMLEELETSKMDQDRALKIIREAQVEFKNLKAHLENYIKTLTA